MTPTLAQAASAIPLQSTPLLGSLYSSWLAPSGDLATFLAKPASPSDWPFPEGLRPSPETSARFWQECLEQNRRLGACPQALALGEAMARGEARAVVAGQQPGLLGGPLFSIYTLATAVAAAQSASTPGMPAGAIFWMASDDTDFPEIKGAHMARALELPRAAIPDSMHVPHRMVGNLDGPASAAIGAELLSHSQGEGLAWVGEAWQRACSRGRDFGEICAAFFFELCPAWPFLVVDARGAALRAASEPVFRCYIERRGEVVRALEQSGARLRERGFAPRLEPRSGESSLYLTQGDIRDRWEIPADPIAALAQLEQLSGSISANVVIRPLVQDSVLPVLAQVVGPGEAAYLIQGRRVAEVLGAPRPALFPRLSLTLWPAEAARLADETRTGPSEILTDYDRLLRQYFSHLVPEEIRGQLDGFAQDLRERATRLTAATQPLDSSLGQLIESARAKMDFQVGRLGEGIASKVKSKHDRQNPRLAHLKGFILPGEKLQERTLSVAAVFASRGPEAASEILELARRHVHDTVAGKSAHYLMDWQD